MCPIGLLHGRIVCLFCLARNRDTIVFVILIDLHRSLTSQTWFPNGKTEKSRFVVEIVPMTICHVTLTSQIPERFGSQWNLSPLWIGRIYVMQIRGRNLHKNVAADLLDRRSQKKNRNALFQLAHIRRWPNFGTWPKFICHRLLLRMFVGGPEISNLWSFISLNDYLQDVVKRAQRANFGLFRSDLGSWDSANGLSGIEETKEPRSKGSTIEAVLPYVCELILTKCWLFVNLPRPDICSKYNGANGEPLAAHSFQSLRALIFLFGRSLKQSLIDVLGLE